MSEAKPTYDAKQPAAYSDNPDEITEAIRNYIHAHGAMKLWEGKKESARRIIEAALEDGPFTTSAGSAEWQERQGAVDWEAVANHLHSWLEQAVGPDQSRPIMDNAKQQLHKPPTRSLLVLPPAKEA